MEAAEKPSSIFRRRIVEVVTDDLRDGYRQMLGLSEANVISHLRIPPLPGSPLFRGGLFDLNALLLDRDTPMSPEILLVRGVRHVSGIRDPELEASRGGSLPTVIQDPWHRTPRHNLWTLVKLVELPPEQVGSLTSAVLAATARALLWTSSARSECFTTVGESAMVHLSRIANAKGHAPVPWLAAQALKFRQAINVQETGEGEPEFTKGLETVQEVVRQQAAGVRPPSNDADGPAPASGRGGGGEGRGRAGGGAGLGAHTRGAGGPLRDNRVVDGDLHALVDALREDSDDRHFIEDGRVPDFDYPSEDYGYPGEDIPDLRVDPEEVAAFANIDANQGASTTGSPTRAGAKSRAKGGKRKSSPDMGNVSFGRSKPRPNAGPRVG